MTTDQANTGLAPILEAASFAADRHRAQRRKDAEASPYINHPLALASVLSGEGGVGDPTVIMAALLHDTVEDTETSLDEIASRFGADVAAIVGEVTDDKSLDKAERKRLQVVKAGSKSPGAKLVKLADKICNLRDIASTPPADWSAERRVDYFHWSREVVAGLRGINAALEAAFDRAYEDGLASVTATPAMTAADQAPSESHSGEPAGNSSPLAGEELRLRAGQGNEGMPG